MENSPIIVTEPSSFGGFRMEGFPTQYPEHKTPAHVDVLVSGIILSFVMLAATFLLVLPSWRGHQRLNICIRIYASLVIGGIIFTTNFGQNWESAVIKTNSTYKPGIADEVQVEVGMHLGLRAINITLRALPVEDKDIPASLKKEKIDYNEEFPWTWDQGRFGFGPNAGRLQRTFREGQRKGLPLPILWVADYFTFDGEGYRFGRFYRTAGWYAHIAMWTALSTWMLSVILLHSAVAYGALLTLVTGLLQLIACSIWAGIRNPELLIIPFENDILITKYGGDFWVTIANGIACSLLGIAIFVLNIVRPDLVITFFGIDPLAEYDEYHLSAKEIQEQHPVDKISNFSADVIEEGQIRKPETISPDTLVVLKRRTVLADRAANRLSYAPQKPVTQGNNRSVPQVTFHNDRGHVNSAFEQSDA